MGGNVQEVTLKAHRHTSAYSEAFEAFLSCTDEKKVLAREIGRRVRERKARSILDIGAGNGDLAIPLSKMVRHYTAIEPNPKHSKKLRDVGLEVIKKAFPCKIEELFDIVLASHSIPWDSERYEAFIETAWELITPGGLFVGVTYDDATSEWAELLTACGLESKQSDTVNDNRLTSMLEWMKKFGVVQIDKVTTFTASENLDKVIAALAFVYSHGVPEDASRFQTNRQVPKILEENYKMHETYEFPWNHLIIQVTKS